MMNKKVVILGHSGTGLAATQITKAVSANPEVELLTHDRVQAGEWRKDRTMTITSTYRPSDMITQGLTRAERRKQEREKKKNRK